MAMLRSAVVAVAASVLAPHATAEATTSSVFTLLAQLQQQQQARRQATRGGALALLQRSEPVNNAQSTEKTFRGLDTNSDGVLSRDEIATFATSQGLDAASAKSELALLDTDGDGALNMSEFIGVLSSSDATEVLNSADTADAIATSDGSIAASPPQTAAMVPEAMATQVALPAQAAAQQASQAPAAFAALSPVQGPLTQAVASPIALPSVTEQSASASSASSAGVMASSEFVSSRAKQLLASWNKFESDAKHAEAEAAALRAKATEELREAQELTAIADYALTRAKQASIHPAGEEVPAGGNPAATSA